MRLRSISLLKFFLGFVVLIVVFALGWYTSRLQSLSETVKNTAQPVRYQDPDYPLINPLVSVVIPNATGFPELRAIKSDVQNIINAAKQRGVTNVGVYFRLPVNAHWFGINENDKFDPGSLIKVPIMLAYLKEAETTPHILEDRLYYNPKDNDPLPNALPAQLSVGTYPASHLLEAMIVDSDNVAKDVLASQLSDKALQDVFDETNSNFLQDPSGTITPKQYIIMLSRIYSATYLDRYYSNYAMSLLSKTTFKDGVAAGLPANVQVAHKYGERGVYEDNRLVAVELHDCGLVYAETPYNICIMTKGSDENVLAGVIRDISAAVYKDRASFKPAS
jgi:beta-lactamase class A